MIDNKVYRYVLERIEREFPYLDILPDIMEQKYVVAGGSVSNIIYEYFTGVPAIINDIDIFFKHPEDKPLNHKEIKDRYPGTNFNQNTIITKTSRVKNINLIEIETHGMENHTNTTFEEIILENFDLNCVQSGLTQHGLVYTKNFLNFLETKEIKIINLVHFFGTICRVFKKVKDLRLTIDADPLMYALTQFIYFFSVFENTEPYFRNYIPPDQYESKIEPVMSWLEKYFYVVLVNDFTVDSKYTIFPKIDIDRNFQERLDTKFFYPTTTIEYLLDHETEYKQFFERSERSSVYPRWKRV